MNIMIPAWVDGTLQPVEKLEAHKLAKAQSHIFFYSTITKYYFSDEPWVNIILQVYGQIHAALIRIGMRQILTVQTGVYSKSCT